MPDQENHTQHTIAHLVGMVPIFGKLYAGETLKDKLDGAAMETSMLIGGLIFMTWNPFAISMQDDPTTKLGKQAGSMYFGMAGGMYGYVAAKSVVKGGLGLFEQAKNHMKEQSPIAQDSEIKNEKQYLMINV